jgi:hypothetical protein
LAKAVIPILCVPEYCPCTVHNELSQIDIPTLADTEQPIFASGTVLAWREPQRNRKITSFGVQRAVSKRTRKCASRKWPDTAQRKQSPCYWVIFHALRDPLVKIGNPLVKVPKVINRIGKQHTKVLRQSILRIFDTNPAMRGAAAGYPSVR